MTDKFKESLAFVIKYYRRNAFQPDEKMFKIVPSRLHRWRRIAVAASVVFGVLLASAFLYVNLNRITPSESLQEEIQEPVLSPEIPEVKVVKRIEFKNATLQQVALAINETYGVEVIGYNQYNDVRITLSYEGTAEDLVGTINDLLGIELTISEDNTEREK